MNLWMIECGPYIYTCIEVWMCFQSKCVCVYRSGRMDGWIIEGLCEVCGWWGFRWVMGVFLVVGWEVVKDVFVCVGGWVLGLDVSMLNWICATQHSMTRFAQGSEACLHAFQMWECAKVSFHRIHPSLSSSLPLSFLYPSSCIALFLSLHPSVCSSSFLLGWLMWNPNMCILARSAATGKTFFWGVSWPERKENVLSVFFLKHRKPWIFIILFSCKQASKLLFSNLQTYLQTL